MSEPAAVQRQVVIDRVMNGPGHTAPAARRAAFDNAGVDPRASALVDKTARRAWTVTAPDVTAATSAGMNDDEVFELVVAAALGQSARQLDAALAALDEATAEPLEGGGE